MKKSFLITFEPKFAMIIDAEPHTLTDKTTNPFIEVERQGQKYFINKERILYFKEYNEEKDGVKVYQA